MKSRDFCYWLQGFFEITKLQPLQGEGLTQDQLDCIEKHLHLVFEHEIDPSFPPSQLDKLKEIHEKTEAKVAPKVIYQPRDDRRIMC